MVRQGTYLEEWSLYLNKLNRSVARNNTPIQYGQEDSYV